jgi:hypothetical protein
MKPATAPALTTAFVWSDVPEAMLVRAQADSNWRSGLKHRNTIRKFSETMTGTWHTCWHDWGTPPASEQHLHWWDCQWVDYIPYWGFYGQRGLQWFPCSRHHCLYLHDNEMQVKRSNLKKKKTVKTYHSLCPQSSCWLQPCKFVLGEGWEAHHYF